MKTKARYQSTNQGKHSRVVNIEVPTIHMNTKIWDCKGLQSNASLKVPNLVHVQLKAEI